MAAEKTQEDVRRKWLKIRSIIRWANQELREAQERLRVMEQGNPWLATIDGILRNLNGSSFHIPKGPKVGRVPPRTEEPEVSPQQEGQPPSRSVDKEKPKTRTAPLIEKSRREAEARKRKLQISFSSEEDTPRYVRGSCVQPGGGTCEEMAGIGG